MKENGILDHQVHQDFSKQWGSSSIGWWQATIPMFYKWLVKKYSCICKTHLIPFNYNVIYPISAYNINLSKKTVIVIL